MGNNSVKGDIYIQTDQPSYNAGDIVTGKVHLNLKTPFDADTLVLKVKGYEESYFQEQKQETRTETGEDGQEKQTTHTYYEDHEGKNSFYSHKMPLYSWPGKDQMQPGQYTFPFQFKLMDTLPGTFSEEGKQDNTAAYKAQIKYKVKAEIEGAHDEKLKNKQELVIRELIKNYTTGDSQEKIVKPTTWCCISQGESKIKCYFQKNSYMPGEVAYLCADLDNSECKLDITDMQVTFNKELHLKSKQGKELRIRKQVQECKFKGVEAGEKAINEMRRQAEIYLQGKDKKPIQSSTSAGKLVRCTYNISVLANLSGCICCSSEPEVSLPINIFAPPPFNYGVVNIPQNWNPQVYDVKNIAFSSDQMYQKGQPVNYINNQMPPQYPPVVQPQQQYPPVMQPQQQYPPVQQQYPPAMQPPQMY